jgi:endonuclease YncB( thermonuclease family)
VTRNLRTLLQRARVWTAFVIVLVVGVVAVPPAPAQDRDCGDFVTQAAAQAHFVALGGPTYDPDRLDADSDGIACEALPCPCSSNAGSAPEPTPTSTPTVVPPPTATPTPTPAPQAPATKRSARIVRVIDGDTLRVRLTSGQQITVRLIGIDTPETKRPGVAVECGGKAASAFMHQLAFRRGRGRQVTLVGDRSQDATDRYGRTLAYVDASAKGDLGRLMLRAGWATVYVFANPFERLVRYETAAGQAKARGTGAWTRCNGDFHRTA